MKRLQQILVDNGYDLGYSGITNDGVDGDFGKLSKKNLTTFIQNECKRLGYIFFHKNLYWFRMSDEFTDKFSDYCAVVRGGKVVFVCPATTKAGKYWVSNPVTAGGITGTGVRVEGQTIGSHRFSEARNKWNGLRYFRQIAKLLVYRDGNKDKKIDKNVIQIAPSWFGFQLHSMGRGFSIWNWSAGCLGAAAHYWKTVCSFFDIGDVINDTIFEV